MNGRMNARLSVALPLMLAILMSFSVGFAQDEGGDSSTEPTGVEGIAKAADNFNVSAVPSQEQAKSVVNTPPATSDGDFFKQAMGPLVGINNGLSLNVGRKVRPGPSRRQTDTVIFENTSDEGNVLRIFADYSVVITDSSGMQFFHGYLARNAAGSPVIVGTNTKGTQYVGNDQYILGLTADGDVLLGINNLVYTYHYDKDGNFVSLTDSDGNGYAVETTDDGGFTITDAAGDTGNFNPDGSYDILDQAGEVLDQGALFGEDDGDPESSLDGGEDTGSLDENSADETDSALAPDDGGDSSGGDNGDGG